MVRFVSHSLPGFGTMVEQNVFSPVEVCLYCAVSVAVLTMAMNLWTKAVVETIVEKFPREGSKAHTLRMKQQDRSYVIADHTSGVRCTF